MVGKRQTNRNIKKEKIKNVSLLMGSSTSNPVEDIISFTESIDLYKENSVSLEGDVTLKNELQDWFTAYRPTVASTTALLKILNSRHPEIPLSVNALVGEKEKVIKRTVSPGSYFHVGLENNLLKVQDVLLKNNLKEIIVDIKAVRLDFGRF